MNATFRQATHVQQTIHFFAGEVAFLDDDFAHGAIAGHRFFGDLGPFQVADNRVEGGDENGVFG